MMSRRKKLHRATSVARRIADVVLLAATVFAAYFMWPAFLGGSSQIILVHGHSMEPTYVTGDLVVIDTDATPEIGSIVVFQIPKDEPGGGQLVVHRLIGRRDDGTYITQGDNAPNADVFLTSRSDILGSPRFSIPHGGRVIGMLGSPLGLGAVAGMACTALLWPRKRDEEVSDEEARSAKSTEDAETPVASQRVLRIEDPDVAAEAEAWLQTQLEVIGRTGS